ncbi:hypothetical protein ACQUY5_25720 [Bacillus cereus]|uniref:hypothetical protein n=1 Tax=Bacillus cereus TaxID=1396 RepID=UPI003D17A70E
MGESNKVWEDLYKQQEQRNVIFKRFQELIMQENKLSVIENVLRKEYPNDEEVIVRLIVQFEKAIDYHENGHQFRNTTEFSKVCSHCGLYQAINK